MPSTTSPVVPLLPQAHLLNHDSEERAIPIKHMASLLSGRYQQISSSEKPRSARVLGSAHSYQQWLDERLETAQQESPGNLPNYIESRRLLNSFSDRPFSTPAPPDSKDNEQDSKSYEQIEDYEMGLPQLSKFLDSDRNFCQFRRFGPTAARILLHRELQLISLVKKLRELDREDANDISRQYRLHTAENFKKGDPKQAELLREIEIKLNEYYDLLQKYLNIRALGKPSKRDQQSIHNWMSRHNPMYPEEQGFMLYFDDLVSAKDSMGPAGQESPIEDMIESYIANNPHSLLKKILCKVLALKSNPKSRNPKLIYYSFEALEALARIVQAFIAVSLLLTPGFILFLKTMPRIAMVCTVFAFVFMFAIALATLTKAKKQDILVGTAAYGAYLMTFLSGMTPTSVSN